MQQETMAHILSIPNMTWYAAQINRQHINILMDSIDEMVQDVNNLYNLTTSLATSFKLLSTSTAHKICLNKSSRFALLLSNQSWCISWTLLMQPLLEHFYPMFYSLQTSNRCYPTLKSLYLPPCIYQYHLKIHYTFIDTCTHMFSLPTESFLLLIDVPIQDQTQQISIYRIFTSDIPHGNFTACYEVDTKYLAITWDKTMAVEMLYQQYQYM